MKKDFYDRYINEMVHEEIKASKTLFQENGIKIEKDRIKRKWIDSGLLDGLTLIGDVKFPTILIPFIGIELYDTED